jgi:predicted metal-dependent RNase
VPSETLGPNGFQREDRQVEIKLPVSKVSGFSAHPRGQQTLDWLHNFCQIGAVYVVHGDETNSTGLAESASKMGLNAVAPQRDQVFPVTTERVKPGPVLALPAGKQMELARTDL